MKVKRIIAKDMRSALRKVRDSLGSDAVIISNKQIPGGVELVTALDYDPDKFEQLTEIPVQAEDSTPNLLENTAVTPVGMSTTDWIQDPALVAMQSELSSLRAIIKNQLQGLAWRDLKQQDPIQALLLQRLMDVGLSPDLCQDLVCHLSDEQNINRAWQRVLSVLVDKIQVVSDDILETGGVMACVGPTGVGKTTTIAKLAAQCVMRHGRDSVAFITSDSFGIGGAEQLRTYSRIIGATMRVVEDPSELPEILTIFRDKHLVLIDTAGMSQWDQRIAEELGQLALGDANIKVHLVLSSTSQTRVLDEAVKTFQPIGIDALVLTKLDETVSLGEALSVAIKYQLPISHTTDGQKIPDDISIAEASRIVSQLVAIAQRHHGQKPADEVMALAFGGARPHG